MYLLVTIVGSLVQDLISSFFLISNKQVIIKIIKEKPSDLDLVLTGRDVKEEIVELADLVTEMKEIKHPFKSGIKAKKGIDF